ncbi:MAG: hypothetical protein EZS28_016390 [Streblomastix strix]|uniref:Uncharacterized protein n=1 Tax=Streblomastix strix TaxID=222440 RepID=A0A5J4W0R7_9EUKA|nr:MAG: hypothetical protein EZS28_016390 [Streblomastix strix]
MQDSDKEEQTNSNCTIHSFSGLSNRCIESQLEVTLQMSQTDLKIRFHRTQYTNWHINIRNQKNAAGILCILLRKLSFLGVRQIKSLNYETDYSSATYNICSGLAVIAGEKQRDRIMDMTEGLSLQLNTFHILCNLNIISDSLSGITTSSDYQIHHDVYMEEIFAFQVQPSINMIVNRCNMKFKWFVTFEFNSLVTDQNCLFHTQTVKDSFLFPPITMIQATHNRVKQEEQPALEVVLIWPFQP